MSERWIARAPGRINVIGEHTDYNDGFVLPMAIDRTTTIEAVRTETREIVLRSSTMNGTTRIDLTREIEKDPVGSWANYARGVVAGFLASGYRVPGFEARIHSTVPLGGGLSSSASLEVALATVIEGLLGEQLDPLRKALLCRQAENDYAGVPCGIMDQFICTLAREDHLMLLDCRSRAVDWIRLPDPSIEFLVVRTSVRHELAGGEYAVRRQQCAAAAQSVNVATLRDATRPMLDAASATMDCTLARRACHVISENQRTLQAVRAIREGDWPEVGRLMYSSHDSLRDDFEVSCAELDAVVEIARRIGRSGGVFGCRMTGGGFGGCAVALVEKSKASAIAADMATSYRAATGADAEIFVSRPAQGATLTRVTD